MELSDTVQLERPKVRTRRNQPTFGDYAEQLCLSNEHFANMPMGSTQAKLLLSELCLIPLGRRKNQSSGMFGISVKESERRRAAGLLMTIGDDASGGLEIDQLFIAESYRGRGYGRAALNLLELGAKKDGVTGITVGSTPNAVRFYEKQGYIAEDQNGTLTIMRKSL